MWHQQYGSPRDVYNSPARIVQATFLGSLNDYVLSVDGIGLAAPLTLRVQAPAQLVLAEGTATSLSICQDCAVLVSDPA